MNDKKIEELDSKFQEIRNTEIQKKEENIKNSVEKKNANEIIIFN